MPVNESEPFVPTKTVMSIDAELPSGSVAVIVMAAVPLAPEASIVTVRSAPAPPNEMPSSGTTS